MKNTFGNSLCVTIFGESHGSAVGAVIDGITPGLPVDDKFIASQLALRRPSGSISTARREPDEFKVVSGVFRGVTTGTPICIIIPNSDTRSDDYAKMQNNPRPSHADLAARYKYHGNEDFRGGGHFSGRITAALVAAAAIVIPALNKKGIHIGSHIKSIAGIEDRSFTSVDDVIAVAKMPFAVLDSEVEGRMTDRINAARAGGDSAGGIIETAVTGLPAGVGEPWFDTAEGLISHAVFSVPAVKGIEFGAGFAFSEMSGREANDQIYCENGEIKTFTNNSGGINGGITNGMPVVFRSVIKPTPTIGAEQKTVDITTLENTTLKAAGRHDPCIVHRARVVIDSITALCVADMLLSRYGTDWLGE